MREKYLERELHLDFEEPWWCRAWSCCAGWWSRGRSRPAEGCPSPGEAGYLLVALGQLWDNLGQIWEAGYSPPPELDCLTLGSLHWNLMVASKLIVWATSSMSRMLLRFQLALVVMIVIIHVVQCWWLCCQIWNIALRPDGKRLSAWIRNFSEVVVRRQVEHWGLLGKGEEGKGEQQQDKKGHLCEHCSQDEKLGLSEISWSSRIAPPLCTRISLWVTRICDAHRGLNEFPPNPDSIS